MNISKVGREIARIDGTKKSIYIGSKEDNNEYDIKTFNELNLKSGQFVYQPKNEEGERDTVYVAGSSGSGKSYWIKNYTVEYHKKFKSNKIYLFSESDEDPLFDKVTYIKRVKIDDGLLEDPIEYTEFENCLVIFDDVDALTGNIKKYIYGLLNKLLKNSRKFGVSVVVSNHNLTDGHQTKSILNECQTIVFFMHNNFNRGMQYLLNNYIGLDKKAIDKLKNDSKFETRATVYIKSYPQIIMTERMITTINQLSQ